MAYPPVDWKQELLTQLEFYWNGYFWSKVESLEDEEFFWEPVTNSWTVRQQSDGTWTFDKQSQPEPVPPPFTTIAWRIMHMYLVLSVRDSRQFGDQSVTADSIAVPSSAKEGLEYLKSAYDSWRTHLSELPAEEWARPSGPTERHYSQSPLATLVLHISREFMHHGGEVCLLRDLYRNRETLNAG